ncbi:MAG: ATP-binding protein [Lachnospiraceae bacterium]
MKLIKILSDKVQIKTDQSEFKDIRINELISLSDGSVELITVVVSISDTDAGGALGDEDFIFDTSGIKTLECSIIGSVQNECFSKAIEKYPMTDVKAEKVVSERFRKMLKPYENEGFYIGSYASYDCPAYVNGNKFFQRHACIVGNTGSGKSETVAKILEQTSKFPGTNIIVFDIHGEYSDLSYARNIKVGNDFHFPIWMFSFSDMVADILKVREETSSVVMSALRKCYYQLCPDGKENRPVQFDFRNMLSLMEALNVEEVLAGEIYKTGDKAGTAKTVKGDFYGKLSGVINTMKDKLSDGRYSFLFYDDQQTYLKKVLHLIMDNDKPVKNIDLSGVPHDVALPLIGTIAKLVYGIQRMYRPDELMPITLVCDEAHVYIPNDFQLSASQKRMLETFEEIAKEGRKFGVTLFPASQRPSELNKTIMAQCANFVVSKLNNENDKSMIKGMLPDGDASVVDAVSTFRPGEVLIIGDAAPIPLKIQVELADERPKSRTIDFWDEWKKGKEVDFDHGIDAYMNS